SSRRRHTRFDCDWSSDVCSSDLLGTPGEMLIAMEATGHYWKNLFAVLAAAGHRIALVNPLRTHRFASENLARTKTDAIDALTIRSEERRVGKECRCQRADMR